MEEQSHAIQQFENGVPLFFHFYKGDGSILIYPEEAIRYAALELHGTLEHPDRVARAIIVVQLDETHFVSPALWATTFPCTETTLVAHSSHLCSGNTSVIKRVINNRRLEKHHRTVYQALHCTFY